MPKELRKCSGIVLAGRNRVTACTLSAATTPPQFSAFVPACQFETLRVLPLALVARHQNQGSAKAERISTNP